MALTAFANLFDVEVIKNIH